MLEIVKNKGFFVVKDRESKRLWRYRYPTREAAARLAERLNDDWESRPNERIQDLEVNFVADFRDLLDPPSDTCLVLFKCDKADSDKLVGVFRQRHKMMRHLRGIGVVKIDPDDANVFGVGPNDVGYIAIETAYN